MKTSKDLPPEVNTFVTLSDIGGGEPVGPARVGADWNFWRDMPLVEIWKAVYLSCNIDPDSIIYFGSPEKVGNKEVANRMRQTVAHYLLNGWIAVLHPDIDESYSRINLPEFSRWALSMNWPIPSVMEAMAKVVLPQVNQLYPVAKPNADVENRAEVPPENIDKGGDTNASFLAHAGQPQIRTNDNPPRIMKRAVLVRHFSAYSGLKSALQNNGSPFVECRVPKELAPGQKGGSYYVEKIEKACLAKWGELQSLSSILAAPICGIHGGKKYTK